VAVKEQHELHLMLRGSTSFHGVVIPSDFLLYQQSDRYKGRKMDNKFGKFLLIFFIGFLALYLLTK
jgi:hypothetical protein